MEALRRAQNKQETIGGSALYLEQTKHNRCTLSQTSGSASISPVTLDNSLAVAQQISGSWKVKITRTAAVRYLTFQLCSLTTCVQLRETAPPEDLLLAETKKSFLTDFQSQEC